MHQQTSRDEIIDIVPTTLTGLALFVILLLPGFAYVIGKERHGTGQQPAAFRDTAAIVAASFSAEIVVLALFAIARTLWPFLTPDVGALVRDPSAYIRGTGTYHGHYGQVAIWGVALLAIATGLGYAAALPQMRKFLGEYPHSSTVSAWWRMFDTWENGRDLHVGCVLADGSYVEGYVASFSRVADDQPERDLVLKAPIRYRAKGQQRSEPFDDWHIVSVSAAQIVTLFVLYEDKALTTDRLGGATSQPADSGSGQLAPSDADSGEPTAAGR